MHDMIDIINTTYILFQVEINVRWNIYMYAYLMHIHNAITTERGKDSFFIILQAN